MYKTGEDGTYTPYEGYCEETLLKNYVKEIGNAQNCGCGFEIDASKTNASEAEVGKLSSFLQNNRYDLVCEGKWIVSVRSVQS